MNRRTDPPKGEDKTRDDLPAGLAAAVRWLDANPDQPMRLDTLAAIAGVRPRTLEAQFRRHLDTTPLGWARRTRLARARHELLAAGDGATVTDVATANGFNELGRFAAQYSAQFGESPSQTLRAARAASPDLLDPKLEEALRLSWRALASAFAVAPDSCGAAIADAEQAQEAAPRHALPKAIGAWCWSQRAAHNFSGTPQSDRARGVRFAEEAARLAPHDALVLSLCSGALTLAGQLGEADRLVERALATEPWSPWGWVRRGWLSAYAGDSDGALRELQITLRLMPFEPLRHLAFIGIGCAHFGAGRYERAARWVADGVAAGPDSFWAERVLVAALAHAGAREEARRRARGLLRKDPRLTVRIARRAWPFTSHFMDRLGDGLLMSGVTRA